MKPHPIKGLRGISHGQDALRARLKAQLDAAPIEGPPARMRARFAALIGPGPDGVPCTLGGVPCLRHGDGPPVLWLHGGGYVFGSPETHARAAAALARLAHRSVILPDYRLSPEHPWPAPLHDIGSVLSTFDAPVPVIGDSAGGHLALVAAQHWPGRVRALALISPNTDRTGRSRTRALNSGRDLTNDDAADTALARLAMPDLGAQDPDASPLLGDLSRLPPTYLTATPTEVLFDDAVLLMRALVQAGRPVSAAFPGDLWHLWPLWPGDLDAADATLAEIAAFLDAHGTVPATSAFSL